MYQAYLASKGIHVGEDGLTAYLSRCTTVVRMIVVSPPSDFKYAQCHKLLLGMMFSNSPRSETLFCFMSDCRDLSVLSQTLGKAFGDYVAENGITGDSLTVNLAARLSALTAFQNDRVHAPQNMCWMFLVMHQLVYDKIAEKYPELCGYAGAPPQRIHKEVNMFINIDSESRDEEQGDGGCRRKSGNECCGQLFMNSNFSLTSFHHICQYNSNSK